MKTNLFKYILMGSLAMSGAYAGGHDAAGDVKKDDTSPPDGYLIVDKEGDI